MVTRGARLGPVALTLFCLWAAPEAGAAERVYWSNLSSPSISFAHLNGSGGGDLNTTGASLGGPRGVTIDAAAGRIYWAASASGTISFTNLDNTGGGGDLNTTGATVSAPEGPAVYPAAGLIYWPSSFSSDQISFASLDGTGGGDLNTTGATLSDPIGVAVDPASGRIFWANANPTNKISFANLDGSGGGGDLNTAGATVNNPHGVALDPAAGRIYWANTFGAKISFANLNGTGGGDLNTTGATVSNPAGVAIDAAAGRIYWGNCIGNKISFANLDGSGGGGDLTTTGATTNCSIYPALLESPSGAGLPEVTGADRTLSCTQGSWAPDLIASFLYRAPQSFAYQWSHNGSDIEGATGSSFTAGPAGEYRCRVTARNEAGSGSQTSAPHAVAKPSNRFSFGKAKLNKKKGTATLDVIVPGPGELALSGKGVKPASAAGALTARSVPAAGTVQLPIRATGKKKKKLKRKGKVSLSVAVTYTPTFGDPGTQSTRVKLKKRGKR